MKNQYRKLHAFTLLEMILAMIISAIIISLIFVIFVNLQDTWGSFHAKQEKIKTLLLFKKTFERELDNADVIKTTNEKEYYLLIKGDTIQYSFDTIIVRKVHSQLDTFSIAIKNVRAYYIQAFMSLGIVRQIEFDVVTPISIESVIFLKHYTSEDLVQLLN